MNLKPSEIDQWQSSWALPSDGDLARPLREKLTAAGLWHDGQVAARHWPMGCIALEITQRCNLDCTLCYLSDSSEATVDVPLSEIMRRIDLIRARFGTGVPLQISGGDPTLRRRDELVSIVARIATLGMTPALFTNGIRASRDLLSALAVAGLADVCFHVDMTQQRRGYGNETALNELRRDYIERARGLGLSVMFNTTVFGGNFDHIPAVVDFFRKHADVVDFASFQLQANTGRGVLRQRDAVIDQRSVIDKIDQGLGTALNFDAITVGNDACNKYASCLIAGKAAHDLLDNSAYIRGLFARTRGFRFDRHRRGRGLASIIAALAVNPGYWGKNLARALAKLWAMKGDIVRGRGRVHKLSFFVHNFMDAASLERTRCLSCIYMVATDEGPVSMCVHNARRDSYILKPLVIDTDAGPRRWHPLTGALSTPRDRPADRQSPTAAPIVPLKKRKGRSRMATGPAEKIDYGHSNSGGGGSRSSR